MKWVENLEFLDLFKTENNFFVSDEFSCTEGIDLASYPILSYPIQPKPTTI